MPIHSPKAPAMDMMTFMTQLGSKPEPLMTETANWQAVRVAKQRMVVVAKRAMSLVSMAVFMVSLSVGGALCASCVFIYTYGPRRPPSQLGNHFLRESQKSLNERSARPNSAPTEFGSLAKRSRHA